MLGLFMVRRFINIYVLVCDQRVLSNICLGRFTMMRVIGLCVWAGFTVRSCYRTHILGWLTKHASYQTHVENLSIDNSFSFMRYWSWI
jgi:hypothetical protein